MSMRPITPWPSAAPLQAKLRHNPPHTCGAPRAPMAFTITASEGDARCGTLETPHAAITTPAMLLATRRGGHLTLTPDLLDKLRPLAQAVQVDVLQL